MKKNGGGFVFGLSAVIFIITSLFALRMIAARPMSPDSYLHIGIGKKIMTERTVPTAPAVSYKQSQPSLEWITHGWLGDTLLYLASTAGGRSGVAVFTIAMLALSVYLCFRLMELLQVNPAARLLTTSLMLFIVPVHWRAHPTVLLIPLFLTLHLSLWLYFVKRRTRPLYAIPLISLLIANVYGGFIFIYLLTVLSYMAYAVLGAFISKRFRKSISLTRLALIITVSLVTTLANPLGARIWAYVLSFSGIMRLKSLFSTLSGFLTLINQSFLRDNISAVPYALAAIVLVSLPVLVLIHIRRGSAPFRNKLIILPGLLVIILPFIYIRLIPFALMSIAPAAALALSAWGTPGRRVRIIAASALALVIPVAIYYVFTPYKTVAVREPVVPVRVIQRHSLPGNIYTTPEYTGYVFEALQQRQNIDLFDDLFDESEILSVLVNTSVIPPDKLQQAFDGFGINTVLVGKETNNIARVISGDMRQEWALIYFDNTGFIFVRRNTVSVAFLDRHELRHINLGSNLGVNQDQVKEATTELERFVKAYPGNTLALGQLATLYRIQGRSPRAEEILYALPPGDWDYTVYTELGRVKASMGQCEEAEAAFKQALADRTEQNYSRATLDIAIVYAGCFNDKTRAKHFFERYLSYSLPQSEKEKARELAEDFGVELEK